MTAPAERGKRVTAVVLVTDLVGSTALRFRVGEEATDDLRRKHDRLLVDAVETHRGQVVKGLGDGIMARFVAAADGVAAAMAIQQAVDRFNRTRRAAVPLAVRIGVSAGDISDEDGDIYGTAVIEASRLCAAADGGGILAADVVRILAGGSGQRPFAPVGRLDLKGFAEPVAAVRVDWEPVAVSAVPLPTLLTDMGKVFVGREAELERLRKLWRDAAAGERCVALLGGEPGVGKTRLAADVAVRVHDDGGLVLAGRCEEGLGVPYQPFVQALRHYALHTPAGDLRGLLGRFGGELVRLVPELVDAVPDLSPPLTSDAETERYRLFDAVTGWLGSASLDEPLFLVLDDLQWAATPTLLLLRHIVRSPELKRVLVLGTFRDSEVGDRDALAQLLTDVRRESRVERLSLTGLDPGSVAAFVERASGVELDDDYISLARAIHVETEGNPFFVREILRHLGETGVWARRDWRAGSSLTEFGIADGVREMVAHRVARISGEARRLLEVAAVAGVEFEPAVIREAEALDDERLVSGLEEALGARLVADSGSVETRLRFSHAIVRNSLYNELSGPRRLVLHRRIGEALEVVHEHDLDDHLPTLVHHWSRAGSTAAETRRVVDYAVRAGDRALTQLAYEEAVAYYRQALAVQPHGPTSEAGRLGLMISLGDAQRRAGDSAHREILLSAARLAQQRGDHLALARAALANSRDFLPSFSGQVDEDRVDVLAAAINAIEPYDDPIRARLLAALALELVWSSDMERRTQLADAALDLARRIGDAPTLAGVLLSRYWTVPWAPLSERTSNADDALRLTRDLKNPTARSWALSLRFRAAAEGADPGEADRCFQENEALVADLREPGLQWVVAMQRAGRALVAGQFQCAEHLTKEAFELGQTAGQLDAPIFYLVQLGAVRFEQGRTPELVDMLSEAQQRWPRLWIIRALSAIARWEAGEMTQARAILGQEAAEDFLDIKVDVTWLSSLCLFGTLAAALDDAVHASVLAERLAAYALQCPTLAHGGVVLGSVSYYLGLLNTTLGRYDAAEHHLATASAVHERLAAPAWAARTNLAHAHMLTLRDQPGDIDRAHSLLGEARAQFAALGLTVWIDRCEAVVRKTRAIETPRTAGSSRGVPEV